MLKEELEIWNSRYIDVNEIVKQNKVLQRDIDNYVDQVKTLMDKIHKMEIQRETECEDKHEDEDDDSLLERKNMFKTKNKITISVSDAQNYNNNNNSDLKKRKQKKVTKIDLNNHPFSSLNGVLKPFLSSF